MLYSELQDHRTGVAVWSFLTHALVERQTGSVGGASLNQLMLLLCAAYVFGCAFRSFLPRADVQRICLFDTWLSSVIVGRSVATVAEVAFVAQWAIILHQLGTMTGAETVLNAAWVIVPLIVVAECFSWYAVLTREFPGQRHRELDLGRGLLHRRGQASAGCCRSLDGAVRAMFVVAIVGTAGYLAFLMAVDVPMYLRRWRANLANGSSAAEPAGRAARRQHALDRDPRHCRVEGRDPLDVALFQRGGLVEPGALRVLRLHGLSAALAAARPRDQAIWDQVRGLIQTRLSWNAAPP